MMPRRRWFKTALAAFAALNARRRGHALAAPAEIRMGTDTPATTLDFETKRIEGWTTVSGEWAVEEMGRNSVTPSTMPRMTERRLSCMGESRRCFRQQVASRPVSRIP